MSNRADLKAAFRAGKASSLTAVDSDRALARWSRKHCTHENSRMCAMQMCPLQHAWMDGFEWDCRPLPIYMARGPREDEFRFSGDEWEVA